MCIRDRDQCADLGHAMDRDPADEIDEQAAIVVQRQEGAQDEALIAEQEKRRHAAEDAEPEGHDPDRGVVPEQEVGEDHEGIDEAVPGREDFGSAQLLGRARRPAPAGQPFGNEQAEPGFVGQHHQVADADPGGDGERRQQDMPARPANGGREATLQEATEGFENADARAVDCLLYTSRCV